MRKELTLPKPAGGYINGLAASEQGLALKWRLEPYHGSAYMLERFCRIFAAPFFL